MVKLINKIGPLYGTPWRTIHGHLLTSGGHDIRSVDGERTVLEYVNIRHYGNDVIEIEGDEIVSITRHFDLIQGPVKQES